MKTSSKDRVKSDFWLLAPSKLDKIEWDIRVGDTGNQVVALRSDVYHARVLELTIKDLELLVEPLGYNLTPKERIVTKDCKDINRIDNEEN